jgi:hypothetical protein
MEGWHEIRQELSRLRATHTALLDGLLNAGPFISGSVVRRFSVCGKAGCRCQRGEKHGPFWYLSRSEGGRNRLRYLRKADAEQVVSQVAEYRRWWRLRQRLRRAEQAMSATLDRLGAMLGAAGEGGAVSCRTLCGGRIRIKPGKPS